MATGPVQGNWRCEMYAAITSQNNTSATISCTAAIQTVNGYHYAGLTVRGSAGVNGQWANVDRSGVSVNPGQNVNMATKTLTIAKTKSVQSIACGGEIRVTGFAAGVSGATMTVSVPALASHKVTYNANGGTGAPGAQTKWYGEILTLSTAKPTRANYVFQGWSRSSNGAVAYQPGAKYGSDTNMTLYAVWKLATKPPTISSFSAQRVNAAGELDESSTSVKLTAAWKCDTAGDAANSAQSLKFAYQTPDGAWVESTPAVSGASGTTTITIDGLSADETWRFRATLKDKYGSVTSYATVGPQRFLLDFSADGKGIGIGMGAPVEGVAIAGTPVTINGCTVPRMFKGTKVVTPSSSSNRHDLFTAEQWAAIVGEDIDASVSVVLVANGDLRANNIALTGAGWNQDDKCWYVFCGSATATPFRVNYTIII